MGKWLREIGTDVYGLTLETSVLASKEWSATDAAANDADAIMTSTAGKTSKQTITADLANPPCPRTLTVTAGGTAGDIKAGAVKVYGTNYAGEEIYEEFTFTADTAATKTGTKVFVTVSKVEIPAQDGTGCTFTVGTGSGLGLPFKFSSKPLFMASFNGSADAGTLSIDATHIEGNYYTPASSLNAKVVKIALAV